MKAIIGGILYYTNRLPTFEKYVLKKNSLIRKNHFLSTQVLRFEQLGVLDISNRGRSAYLFYLTLGVFN